MTITVFSNIAALQANLVALSTCYVQGYYAAGDGGGGMFNEGAAATTNGGTIINDMVGQSWYRDTQGAALNPKWFGAKGDGATDDTAAIVATIATGQAVRFPDGVFCITEGHITLATNGQSITGAGQRNVIPPYAGAGTLLLGTTNAGSSLIIWPAGINYVTLGNFSLSRTCAVGTAASSSHGIYMTGVCTSNIIEKLNIYNQNIGLVLSGTFFSIARDIIVQACTNDGIRLTVASGNSPLQWTLTDILTQVNTGHGIHAIGNSAGGSAGAPLNPWRNIESYGNSGCGFYVSGTSACPLYDLRMTDCYAGGNGGDNCLIDSYGGNHLISNLFSELAGTGSTGPNYNTPPSHVGSGLNISANNTAVSVVGGYLDGNSQDGIVNLASHSVVSGALILNHPASTFFGIANGGTALVVNGCSIHGNAGYGIGNTGSITVCVGNDLKTNTAGSYSGTAPVIGGATLNNQ